MLHPFNSLADPTRHSAVRLHRLATRPVLDMEISINLANGTSRFAMRRWVRGGTPVSGSTWNTSNPPASARSTS